MQSMGRSMDWTLEDNMVDGLFFCATLTGRRGHTHLYKQERKCPTPVQRRLTSRPTNLHARDLRPSRRSHTPACMLVTSTANMTTGVTTKHLLTVRASIPGKHPRTLECCMTQRKHPVSSLTDGTSAQTRIWPLRVSARTADCQTDVFLEISSGYNIGPPSYRHQDSRFLPVA